MQKCHFCIDRLAENRKPVCVDACPMRALDAGPIEELVKKYGGIHEAEGFTYSEQLRPCTLFKPKKDAEARAVVTTTVAPGSYQSGKEAS